MGANSFGKLLTVTTFGESHGPAIGCVIDGCPPGLAIAGSRPRPSAPRHRGSRHTPQRREADEVEILRACTRAAPPARRSPADPQHRPAQQGLRQHRPQFRPGHADYTYWQKYGIRDRAAAVAVRRARPRCAWPPASSPRSGWRSASA
jgi:chorismate synthase